MGIMLMRLRLALVMRWRRCDGQMCRCADVQMCRRCADVQMCRCADVLTL